MRSIQLLIETKQINPESLIPVIQEGIRCEKLNYEANAIIGNEKEADEIKVRIYEAEILLSVLRCYRF